MQKVPTPFADIIDNACDLDKLFFEANPSATEYTRAYIPGELWPLLPTNCQLIRVVYLEKGLRARQPILIEASLN